jgi:hypothetical protein
LNRLYLARKQFDLPLGPHESNISYRLKRVLEILRQDFNLYFKKYFNVPHSENFDLLLSACFNAESWLKEKPLSKILGTNYHNDSDKIENTINILQNKISYGLPMLLRPLYSILAPSNPFLRCLELGAYHPIAKRLIEYSVPRETAIYLTTNFLGSLKLDSVDFDEELLSALRDNYKSFDYWTRAQLEALM